MCRLHEAVLANLDLTGLGLEALTSPVDRNLCRINYLSRSTSIRSAAWSTSAARGRSRGHRHLKDLPFRAGKRADHGGGPRNYSCCSRHGDRYQPAVGQDSVQQCRRPFTRRGRATRGTRPHETMVITPLPPRNLLKLWVVSSSYTNMFREQSSEPFSSDTILCCATQLTPLRQD